MTLSSDTNVNMTMDLGGSALVRITRHNGPESNIIVRAYDTHHSEIPSTACGQLISGPNRTKTDVLGMALLEGLPIGPCVIKADGYETESTVEIRAAETVSTTLELP